MHANRVGDWSSLGLVAIGVAYAATLGAGFARHGTREPIGDPVLAVMEGLTLVSAPLVVLLMAALHDAAPRERKPYGVAAVAFATAFATVTSAVHFVELSAGRQLGDAAFAWPSRVYAAELLAWDVLLGLAMLAAGATLAPDGAHRRARGAALACGALCLAGAVGPLVGDMRLQRIGIVGYAVVLPVAALLLRRVFHPRRERAHASRVPASAAHAHDS